MREIVADICVIGGGSGGLSVAAGAAQMGAETVLIERGAMGGDCLNTGCVPSKSLLAAAHAAEAMRKAPRLGIHAGEGAPLTDFAAVKAHIQGVIAAIAPHDSVERFEGLGVTVIRETASFLDAKTVLAGDRRIRARRFVVATGSRPAIPPIEGIGDVPYLTNETIFDIPELPQHLMIVGAGPIGLEMAQGFRRLGSRVTVIEAQRALPRDDEELAAVAIDALKREGVEILEHATIRKIANGAEGSILVHLKDAAPLQGDALLVAAGRRPNTEDLNLDNAGIETTRGGIAVDARLRSTNKRVFAIGDVAGGLQFTHVAGYHAGIVLRNALFMIPARADHGAVPYVTYTDPELAHVGLHEQSARERFGDSIRILRRPFSENDRARAEGQTHGLIKIVTGKGGRILGASIAGPHAGELILPWVLAVSAKRKIGTMAGLIAPYPTLSEISKHVAGSYYTDTLFGPRTRRIVRLIQKLL